MHRRRERGREPRCRRVLSRKGCRRRRSAGWRSIRPGWASRIRPTSSRMNRVRFSNEPPYLPGRRPGGEQLVEQVAVALLEVDEVEADPERQARRGDVAVLQPVELVVGDQRSRRGRRSRRWPCRRWSGGRAAGRAGPGCGREHEYRPEWVSCRPTSRSSSLPHASTWAWRQSDRSSLERRGRRLVDDELAGIGPALRDDGAASPQISLAPPAPNAGSGGRSARPGCRRGSPSHPSIGWIASRLPTAPSPPTSIETAAARGPRPARCPGPAPGVGEQRPGSTCSLKVARHGGRPPSDP